jgi:DNA replication protein DnaC
MLHQPTIEKMDAMRLDPMVQAWKEQEASAEACALPFEDRLAMLVDRLWTTRQTLAFQQRIRRAKLRLKAAVEDIDFRAPRGLDRNLVRSLVTDSAWVERHENVFLTGPTGVGKSWLACALAQKACRDGYQVLYQRAPKLFRELALARADGTTRNLLAKLARIDVLIVDDWAMAPMSDSERRDFWEICEDRYQLRSTILTSQMPLERWHAQIGDPTLADGILDRLVHNAHRFDLKGDSIRKLTTASAAAAPSVKPSKE